MMGFFGWDNSKDIWGNISGGIADATNAISGGIADAGDWIADNTKAATDWIADNTVEKTGSWDSSKGFWDNVGGGIADNTVEKIPGWDSSKGVTENITGGVKDGIDSAVKAVQDVAGGAFDTLKKYWYVPVIVGGVIIGYKLLTRPNPQLIAALSKIRLPE